MLLLHAIKNEMLVSIMVAECEGRKGNWLILEYPFTVSYLNSDAMVQQEHHVHFPYTVLNTMGILVLFYNTVYMRKLTKKIMFVLVIYLYFLCFSSFCDNMLELLD